MAEPEPKKEKRQPFVPTQVENGTLPPLRGSLGRCALGLVAFVGVILIFRRVAVPSGGGIIAAKWQHLQESVGEYDTFFLGTSHVYRGFVPSEFDRVSAVAGRPTSSFNLGIQLPHLYELHFLLREILALEGARPGRIFLEYADLVPQTDPAYLFAPRETYWRDWASTREGLERSEAFAEELTYWQPWFTPRFQKPVKRDGPLPECPQVYEGRWSICGLPELLATAKLRIQRDHLQHFLLHVSMAGRGKDVAKGLLGRPHGETALMAASRGYVPLEEEVERLARQGSPANDIVQRREYFDAHRAEYRVLVEDLKTKSQCLGDLEWLNTELLYVHDLEIYRRMVAECRAAGVEFVLVFMPSNSCDRAFEETIGRELGVPVLRYNLPDRYPELYAEEFKFDSGHLTEEGALGFTRLLARDWLALGG